MNVLEDRDAWPRIGSYLAGALAASSVEILSAAKMTGGAVQNNWRLSVRVADGPAAGEHEWALRTDAAARLSLSLDRNAEAQVLRAAAEAGVLVASTVLEVGTDNALGQPFLLQAALPGIAMARRLTRDTGLSDWGPDVAAALGRQLARIHAITPQTGSLACLPVPMLPPARAEVARLRGALDKAADFRPALEYVLTWLDRFAPPARVPSLVHGDFRTGNYLVHEGALTGILDWEFSHWGDPDEDLGWFTARCWRFGNDDRQAGGIAPLDDFVAAYEAASGRKVSGEALRYWQIMAAAKWATIAVLQGDRLRKDGERKLELALTGLMPAGMEHDALSDIVAWREATGSKGGPQWLA